MNLIDTCLIKSGFSDHKQESHELLSFYVSCLRLVQLEKNVVCVPNYSSIWFSFHGTFIHIS